jgi:hypothetical protein
MCFVGPLFCSFTFYQKEKKKSLPKFDVFNTAFQACMLCGADVTMMLRSHGGLVSVADVTKTKIYKSLMFSSNCIVCILLDKMCIGDVSTINIYMHTHVHHTCQYSNMLYRFVA